MPKASTKTMRVARELVRVRDGDRCQFCGAGLLNKPSSVHHRRPRGMGGSALFESAANLVQVCGTGTTGCHGWIERNRIRARGLGWLVPRLVAQDLVGVPLLTYLGWVRLDAAGQRVPCDPPGPAYDDETGDGAAS